MRSALKPPETTIRTSREAGARRAPARVSVDELGRDAASARRRRAAAAATRRPACPRCRGARPTVARRAPRRPRAPCRTESFSKSTSTVTFISRAKRSANARAARDRVAAVGRDQPVRHGPDAAAAPPRRLRVGRDADRPGDVRRPAVAGLHQPVVVAGGEVQDRLAPRGLDDLADVAHDQRAPRQAAEVDRLEVGEERVVALDRHHRLPRRDLVALVERADLERRPSRLTQRPSAAAAARALLEHRDRLVDRRRASTPCAGRPASRRAGGGPRPPAAPSCG